MFACYRVVTPECWFVWLMADLSSKLGGRRSGISAWLNATTSETVWSRASILLFHSVFRDPSTLGSPSMSCRQWTRHSVRTQHMLSMLPIWCLCEHPVNPCCCVPIGCLCDPDYALWCVCVGTTVNEIVKRPFETESPYKELIFWVNTLLRVSKRV